jgi:two-component system, chemotaxis family, protein-glutamate methylesterase/glutaminase
VIRVLVVDDSVFARKAIVRVLTMHPEIEVVGVAGSGEQALAAIPAARPDLVTLDLDLPGIDGLTTLREIVARHPALPVIVVSQRVQRGAAVTQAALALGARVIVDKASFKLMDLDGLSSALLGAIRRVFGARAAMPVDAHYAYDPLEARPPDAALRATAPTGPAAACVYLPRVYWANYDICVIGASTGGPPALQAILERVPASFPIPIAITQHMPAGVTAMFAKRLNAICNVAVSEAVEGQRLTPGSAVFTPGGSHLTLSEGLTARLSTPVSRVPHRSVDSLMLSAAAVRPGRVVGILLTGMGDDGARGMVELRRSGSLTVGESQATCVVYGMPRAAHERGGVEYLLPLDALCRLFDPR